MEFTRTMKQYVAGLVLILGIIGFIFAGEWAIAQQEAPEQLKGSDFHIQRIQPAETKDIQLFKITDRKDSIVCYNVYVKQGQGTLGGLDLSTAISCVKLD